MTDLEISEALALAIGWHKDAVAIHTDMWEVMVHAQRNPFGWEVFDYRDWNVIGPIAERYDCFPVRASDDLWYIPDPARFEVETTPQKAIAMCVIGSKK